MDFERAGPKGTTQKAEPLPLPHVGQLSTSPWTGLSGRAETSGPQAGAQAWSPNSVFALVYLLPGSVSLEKLQNLAKFSHFSPGT